MTDFPFAFLLLAAAIFVLATLYRRRAGFAGGKTISHDNITLRSDKHRLVGRPDRVVRKGKQLVIEDKKNANKLYNSHRVQMGLYMILAEQHYGERPSHAVVVLRGGRRETVKNTKQLREEVVATIRQVRAARTKLRTPLPVTATAGQCRSCSQRSNCTERVA